jgi:uncharacterized membrane protein YraQ (UPF0718 family)
MTDHTAHSHNHEHNKKSLRLDRVLVAIALLLAGTGISVPGQFMAVIGDILGALGHTGIFIAFAVFLVAYLKATGAEGLVARAFTGHPLRMIVLAAMVGGLAPFCSCEVIPFIAALLAMGVPLSAVMAFWLASPIMDPPMFVITMSTLGLDFAIAKTVFAVGFGLFGGLGMMVLERLPSFADPLRGKVAPSCSTGCCSSKNPFDAAPVWVFWRDNTRMKTFVQTARENMFFLLKWMTLAYTIEVLMTRFMPSGWIVNLLGGTGFQPIFLGALVGAPAYLNGYAAAPLIAGLLEQGMSPGAAMSFIMAGSVVCIPSAVAVWALVKPRIFTAYVGFAFVGALLSGLIWAAIS